MEEEKSYRAFSNYVDERNFAEITKIMDDEMFRKVFDKVLKERGEELLKWDFLELNFALDRASRAGVSGLENLLKDNGIMSGQLPNVYAGKCAEVTIVKGHVTNSGATAHVFCYYSGVNDDESN